MTRHARNCTAGAVYTYHEKRRDAAAGGYGTRAERLGKHAVNHFDCCSLTLQPARDPVVTPQGHLFDKQAILEYIIAKKTGHARALKAFEKQKKADEMAEAAVEEARRQHTLQQFVSRETSVSTPSTSSTSSTGISSDQPSGSNVASGKKGLPSFWVPSQLPDARRKRHERPDATVYCPVSGVPLRAKDLVAVKFTRAKHEADKSLVAADQRYMCPVTHDLLADCVPCAVLRPTGDVVTMECVERLVKPEWKHPLTGESLTERDIIPLQRGGTGFASTNPQLQAAETKPALQA